MLYGGPRLQPEHFEVEWVPAQLRAHLEQTPAMPVGSPGKVGILEMDFELRGGRAELVEHYQKAPLKIIKPHYYDPACPQMAYVYTIDMGGGVVQGDRLRTDIHLGENVAVHVATQSHAKIYAMDSGYATQQVNLSVGPGAYLEYLPDPTIPFAASRFYQKTQVEVDQTATVLLSETLYAGRIGRGERHEYEVYAADLELRRPGAGVFACDRSRLIPAAAQSGGGVDSAVVFDHRAVVHTLYVVTPDVAGPELREALEGAVKQVVGHYQDDSALFAVSALAEAEADVGASAGVWLRFLTNDTVVSTAVAKATYETMHQRLRGTPAPPPQRF